MYQPTAIDRLDQAGAICAILIFLLASLVFAARLYHRPVLGLRIGILLELTALPLVYLLVKAPGAQRSALYYAQIGLMLAFLLAELLLDYALKVKFRERRGAVIAYVMLFFAGTGGMVGVASHAGPGWTAAAGILFLIMGGLAFIQRSVTGN